MTIRFHLDEHIHPGIAVGLRAQGIDVTTTQDVSLGGADDPAQIAFARKESRVVVTHDHHFLRHHAQGADHAGICYCHQDKYSVGSLLQVLLFVHGSYWAEEMKDRLEYL